MTTRVMASLRQQHEIAILLSKYCSTDDKGMAVYAESWSDLRIATTINDMLPNEVAMCTEKHVYSRRKLIYGNIYMTKQSDMNERVAILEAQVAHLIEQLQIALGSRYKPYKPPIGRPASTPPE